ncbi:MAG: addiction module protein [Pseudomonadota bacterium]
MANKMKQLLENIKDMSLQERALLAHCLISSLDQTQDDEVDDAWAVIAEKRFAQIESGEVGVLSWEQIKKEIKA